MVTFSIQITAFRVEEVKRT